MASDKRTRNQQRAQSAYLLVSRVAEKEGWKGEYRTQCLRLPALIHQCGLCQTVAFFQAKASDKLYYDRVLGDLAELTRPGQSGEKLAENVRLASTKEYQWWTREAMACAEWLKRYSEALIEG